MGANASNGQRRPAGLPELEVLQPTLDPALPADHP